MKTSLFLTIVFIVTCLAIVILGATVFMLYDDCLHLSAGTEVAFFSLPVFLKGLVLAFPFACVISCLFMAFYIVRHPNNPLFTVIVYVIIGIAVWLVFIPVSYRLYDIVDFESEVKTNENNITENYFRDNYNSIIYFTEIDENLLSSGVAITNGNASVFEKQKVTDFFDVKAVDPLFYNTVTPTGVISRITSFLQTFWAIGKQALSGNFLFFFAFMSFGLALLSILGLNRCSMWRLCNISWMFVFFFVICHINFEFYCSSVISSIVGFFIERKINFLSDRRVIQIICNSAFTVVFIAIGIINVIKHPNANKEVVEK